MLLLTRLNGHPLALNGDLIKSVESSPDTTIALVTGEKIVVLESLAQVIEIARAHRVHLLRQALERYESPTPRDADAAALAQHAATANTATASVVAVNTDKKI